MPQNPPVSHSAQIAGVGGYDESREREGGEGGADNNETYSPPALFPVQTRARAHILIGVVIEARDTETIYPPPLDRPSLLCSP